MRFKTSLCLPIVFAITSIAGIVYGQPVQSVDDLISALDHEDPRIRSEAAEALGVSGGSRAVAPLIGALNDKNEGVRVAAATALGQFRGSRSIEALINSLDDRSFEVRLSAIEALGETGHVTIVETLANEMEETNRLYNEHRTDFEMIYNGTEEERSEAGSRLYRAGILRLDLYSMTVARSLGKVGGDEAHSVLFDALASPFAWTRSVAANATVRLSSPQALEVFDLAYEGDDLAIIAGAYPYFVAKGMPGSESTLVRSLNAFGTEPMAVDYLNSGNTILRAAASEWARKKGFKIVSVASSSGLSWGMEN